ncbi:hypothetical protein Ancab_000859 [Ancistrocladus abbreviatus]
MPPTPTAPSISHQPHVAPGPHSNAKPYGRMDETESRKGTTLQQDLQYLILYLLSHHQHKIQCFIVQNNFLTGIVVRPVRTVRPGARFVFVHEAAAVCPGFSSGYAFCLFCKMLEQS